MWRRILSPEEILSLSRCEMDLEGDIISWSGPWKQLNVEETVPHYFFFSSTITVGQALSLDLLHLFVHMSFSSFFLVFLQFALFSIVHGR